MHRLRQNLNETHSLRFELIRHFFLRFFDSDFVSTPGQWRVVAAGAVAVILSSSIFFIPSYYHKYLELNKLDESAPYLKALTADVLFLNVVAMLALALLTTIQWTALFPSLRDYLALAALPIRPRDLFIAKFSALVIFAGCFAFVIAAPPSVILPWLQSGRHQLPPIPQIIGNFTSTMLAAVFVFFTLVALQGVLLNITPLRHFQRVSLSLQAALLIALLCAVPVAISIPSLYQLMTLRPAWAIYAPPLWFLGLHAVITGNHEPLAQTLARASLIGTALAALAAVTTYLWSFRRHRVRVLESTAASDADPWSWPAALAARLIPDPRRLAVFAFIAKTLARSRQHRLVLSTFTALAFAVIFNAFIGLALTSGTRAFSQPSLALRQVVVWAPLALSLFVLAGFRYLFRLPVELRANWLFRVNEHGNRLRFLSATERFLIAFAVLPVALITLPVQMLLLGPAMGLAASILCTLPSLILMEVLLFQFDQIPFTSSYLPGRRPVVETLLIYGISIGMYVTLLGGLIAWSLEWPGSACFFFVVAAAILWRVRTARREHWLIGKLEFEERPEITVQTLNIDHD